MNSGSASAPSIKASKFLLAFFFTKTQLKNQSLTNHLFGSSLKFQTSNIANF